LTRWNQQRRERSPHTMKSLRQQLVGNCFLHPLWDYLLIGGVWSILLTFYWLVGRLVEPGREPYLNPDQLVWLVLLGNSAHFAASTVRLYSKPAYLREFSFLAFGFPIVTMAVLGLCVLFPGSGGRYLQVIYLTWAPFHYAKQIYGLSLMYSFRGGLKVDLANKRLIYWTCMMPFLYALMSGSSHMGLGWLLPTEVVNANIGLRTALNGAKTTLTLLTFAMPMVLYWRIWKTKHQALPLIILFMMLANGLWWTGLSFLDAFVIATIAHGIQYMAIMLIYHVREQLAEPRNSHGWQYLAGSFYAKCVVLGYGLFNCWPFIFVWAGAGFAESMLMVIAAINIHHFIVDAYIWRLRVPENQKALADQPAAA
jgi:hypothetical protein